MPTEYVGVHRPCNKQDASGSAGIGLPCSLVSLDIKFTRGVKSFTGSEFAICNFATCLEKTKFSSERNEQGVQNSQGAHFLPAVLGVSIYIEFREKRNPTHVGQLFSAKRRRSHTDLFSVEKEDDLPRRLRCLRHFRRRPASRPDD